MKDEEYKTLLKKIENKFPKKTSDKTRFQIPRFISFIEGNKTIIKNIDEVSKTIRREQNHLMKFMANELASQGLKTDTGLKFIGKFSNSMINKKLDKYVSIYVLCPACKKPDTSIIKINHVVFIKCDACGARKPIQK
ncbi:MAG: translation initiation factor IF-2 subunit beta [Candidatus Aenigmarchaeota archaeon ex4484_52]|nr:MAG: translation initiation factor IF-2 subunit beta [Candidatus Aenigmarchaeota archaeon ex4484_52]